LVSLIPEDPDQAVDFVQQLSKLYRHILEVKDEKSILLKDELDVLKAYAFLLKTRFGNNLEVTIDVPDEKLNKKICSSIFTITDGKCHQTQYCFCR